MLMEFFIDVCIDVVCCYFEYIDMVIKEIVFQCGFDSVDSLCCVFSQCFWIMLVEYCQCFCFENLLFG